VELDDRTHLPAKDAMRDAILESAGIPMLRVNVRDLPTVEALRAMFTK
jgi:very-short-patch-repair endonuclease